MKLFKKILSISLVSVLVAGIMVGCASEKIENDVKLEKGDTIAEIKIEGYGSVKIKMLPDAAPKAVENFTTHAKNGYYDDLTFHRVYDDFMIQGGDPSGTGLHGDSIWGEDFEDEFSEGVWNFTGALSMANKGPNTNSSQFFIVNTPKITQQQMDNMIEQGANYSEQAKEQYLEFGGSPGLDNKHTVFGMVYNGMDVVDEIMEIEVVDEINHKPVETVTIKTIEISTY